MKLDDDLPAWAAEIFATYGVTEDAPPARLAEVCARAVNDAVCALAMQKRLADQSVGIERRPDGAAGVSIADPTWLRDWEQWGDREKDACYLLRKIGPGVALEMDRLEYDVRDFATVLAECEPRGRKAAGFPSDLTPLLAELKLFSIRHPKPNRGTDRADRPGRRCGAVSLAEINRVMGGTGYSASSIKRNAGTPGYAVVTEPNGKKSKYFLLWDRLSPEQRDRLPRRVAEPH